MGNQAKFIADGMLGKIARWLRLMGYDVEYSKDISDNHLIDRARSSNRVLLTKDFELYRRARLKGVQAVYLRGSCLEEDLAQLARLNYITLKVDLKRTRCPLCNGSLREIGRFEAAKYVSPEIVEVHERFWICSKCGKVYWIGKHWISIQERLHEARKLLSSSNSR
ncbi:MAG: hypothetical protein DRJ60_04065 [Thermoprotei archaeon]|nr:MAG: hypothetical protein DRJ60_04065 [Thermoprotei archaeon]